jgi:L-ascorbate metabolism protein UlaG (beta-lactamase superfamily)
VIELDGTRLVTDPLLRNRVAHLRRQSVSTPLVGRPDAILISHHHFDHLDLPSLRSLGSSTLILGGPGTNRYLEKKGFRNVRDLDPGHSARVGPVEIEAVNALHDGRRSPLHESSEAVGFLIRGSRTFYFAGDTDLFPGMADLAGIPDAALLPVWGWGHRLGPGHMDPRRAVAALELIRPRLAIPIHWGTLFPIGLRKWGRGYLEKPPLAFEKLASEVVPETEVRVLRPGTATGIPDSKPVVVRPASP